MIAADGSTGEFAPLCCSLKRVDEARQTSVRCVVAGYGKVQYGSKKGEGALAPFSLKGPVSPVKA